MKALVSRIDESPRYFNADHASHHPRALASLPLSLSRLLWLLGIPVRNSCSSLDERAFSHNARGREARLPFARRRAEIAVTEDRRPSHIGV